MHASVRHDHKRFLSTARERIRDLEAILKADLEDRGESRDASWDATSLRRDYGRK